MNHKLISVFVAFLIIIQLCGCTKNQANIFDTEIYGEYIKETFIDNDKEPMTKQKLNILDNNTYHYYIYQNQNGNTQDENISGNIEIDKVNDDVIKITLSDYELTNEYNLITSHIGNTFYKYKNLIGDYFQIGTEQIGNRSIFSLPLDDSGKYYLRFTEDGMCKSDCTPEDKQYYYKYKVKSDMILIDYGFGFQIEYYVVKDGVFYPNGLIKQK